jgi:hypothetical protein
MHSLTGLMLLRENRGIANCKAHSAWRIELEDRIKILMGIASPATLTAGKPYPSYKLYCLRIVEKKQVRNEGVDRDGKK